MSSVLEHSPSENVYRTFLESLLDVITCHNCILEEKIISTKRYKAELPELIGNISQARKRLQKLISSWKDEKISSDLNAIETIISIVEQRLLWFFKGKYRLNIYAILARSKECCETSKEAYQFGHDIMTHVQNIARNSLCDDKIGILQQLSEDVVSIIRGRYRIVYGYIYQQAIGFARSLKYNIKTITQILPEFIYYLRNEYANLSPFEDPKWFIIRNRQLEIVKQIEKALEPYLNTLNKGQLTGIVPSLSKDILELESIVYCSIFLELRDIYYEVFYPIYGNEIKIERNYPRPIT